MDVNVNVNAGSDDSFTQTFTLTKVESPPFFL